MSQFHFSFAAPLTADAALFLEAETRVPFGHLDTSEWFVITATNDHGAIVGVLTMEPRNYFDWHMSCAIADQRIMTRRLLRTIFRATFTKAARITALVEPGNQRALDQVARMGFRYEGYLRCGIEGTRDACMFGMLPHECLWLKGAPPLAKFDLAHSDLVDPIIGGDNALRAGVAPDRQNFRSRKSGLLIALAALIVGVVHPLGDVDLAGRPAEVARVDAARNAATVSGIVPFRRIAMGEPTDDPVDLATALSLPSHLRVAALVDRERPQEAVVTPIGQGLSNDLFASHALYNKEA